MPTIKIVFSSFLILLFSACNWQDIPQTAKKEKTATNPISTYIPKVIESKIDEPISQMSEKIWNIFQDSNDNYWFGSKDKGVYKYDGKTFTHLSEKDGLVYNQIWGIQEDKLGNVYFDTHKGVSKFDGQNFKTLELASDSKNEWKLEKDDLWFIGNWNKNGVYRYDGEKLYHLKFPKHELEDEFFALNPNVTYSSHQVYKIDKDRKGNIWFGTATFGACRFDGESLFWVSEREMTEIDPGPAAGVRSILEDKDGNFWFNSNVNHKYKIIKNTSESQEGEYSYEKIKGIETSKVPHLKNYFMFVEQDAEGNIWMVRYDGGVWKYDGKDLIHYTITFKNKDVDVLLFKMYKDRQGTLWLTTHNAGALKFNGETFESFKPKN